MGVHRPHPAPQAVGQHLVELGQRPHRRLLDAGHRGAGRGPQSKANPLTYLVDAERALFDGELIDAAVARGIVAGAATCAVGLAVGVRVMRSGTAG
ncbi:MAG TPA: hypothetical protein VFZ79_01870 [Acidimicrobiales bacterium]